MKKTIGIALTLMMTLAGYGFGQAGAVPDGMVRINGGTFTMGSPADELGRNDKETQHQVTVSSFYMGKYEVTQKESNAMCLSPKSYSVGIEKVHHRLRWI